MFSFCWAGKLNMEIRTSERSVVQAKKHCRFCFKDFVIYHKQKNNLSF